MATEDPEAIDHVLLRDVVDASDDGAGSVNAPRVITDEEWYHRHCNSERVKVGGLLSVVAIIALFTAVIMLSVELRDANAHNNNDSTPHSVSSNLQSEVLEKLDKSTPPCQDFYQYACGNWERTFTLPEHMSSWTVAFSNRSLQVRSQLLSILQEKFPFIGTYFDACLDTAAIDSRGNDPLTPWLNKINALQSGDMDGLFSLLGELQHNGLAGSAFVDVSLESDFRDANPQHLYVVPGGTSLPLNQLYNESSRYGHVYTQVLFNYSLDVYRLLGYPMSTASAMSTSLLAFEKKLSKILPVERLNSLTDIINETSLVSTSSFQSATGWPAQAYFAARTGSSNAHEVAVLTMDVFANMMNLIRSTTLSDLKTYLTWHVVYGGGVSMYLPELFRDVGYVLSHYYGLDGSSYSLHSEYTRLSPAPGSDVSLLCMSRHTTDRASPVHRSPAWNALNHELRGLGEGCVDGGLGFATPPTGHHARSSPWPRPPTAHYITQHMEEVKNVGEPIIVSPAARQSQCYGATLQLFTDFLAHKWIIEDFPPENRMWATQLVDLIYAQVGNRLKTVSWLETETRDRALVKWAYIVKNVGYSSRWIDYSSLSLSNVIFNDYVATRVFLDNRMIAQNGVDKPRDVMPTRDYMEENAFYDPLANNINLLAGLMAPPFFSPQMPMMLNLAGYGMVIGHEIFHGFDNNGRRFNGTGAYVNWWDNSSLTQFEARTQCLVNQYDQYVVKAVNEHVNGEQTLGENIADAGGIGAAWRAYQTYNTLQPLPSPLMGDHGISNDQLFFLWYAQSWCSKRTDDSARRQLSSDPHSPAKFRVNGPLSNLPAFAHTFNCAANTPMGKSLSPSRCEVW